MDALSWRLNVRVPGGDGRRLDALREKTGVPTAEFLRRLIRRELDRIDGANRKNRTAG